jgi:hypothetical protein
MLPKIILASLTPSVNEIIGDHQCSFRRNRSATDQIFYIRKILQKAWEYDGTVRQLFINFRKAYNLAKTEVFLQYSASILYTYETSQFNLNVFKWNLDESPCRDICLINFLFRMA